MVSTRERGVFVAERGDEWEEKKRLEVTPIELCASEIFTETQSTQEIRRKS